ncbi:MAG TPA: hypothetical protein VF085_09010 [Solirubrobacterales bacterium]
MAPILDAEWLKTHDHLGADGAIDPHAAERDAGIAAVIEMAAPAVVPTRVAVLAAVGDMQLAAAVAAPQQTGQQRFAAPDRAAAHEAPAIGVVADQALVPLKLHPANVTLVVVEDQNLPSAAILAEAAHDALATGLDRDAAAGAPEGIGAGVDRVRQQVTEGVVDRQLPDHLATVRTIFARRQGQALSAHPQVDLADRLQVAELVEHERDGLLDTAIGILLDPIVRALEVADRHGEEELAAAGLLLQGFERALAEQRQLHLAHRALHTEKQAIVRMPRIVDAVLVDDQRTDQTAELEQRMPVAPVAGEPRCLDRDDGADPTLADRRQQLLEARAGDAGAGTAEIIVNYFHGGPAQGACAIDQAVLPAAALVIVQNLIVRRLADIDEGAAGKVFRCDPGHHRPPRRRDRPARSGVIPCRPPPTAAPGAAASAWPSGRAEAPPPVSLRRTAPSGCLALSA